MNPAPWLWSAVAVALLIIIALGAIRWPSVRRARKGLSDLAAQHTKEAPRAR